jgi:hypothetical protein
VRALLILERVDTGTLSLDMRSKLAFSVFTCAVAMLRALQRLQRLQRCLCVLQRCSCVLQRCLCVLQRCLCVLQRRLGIVGLYGKAREAFTLSALYAQRSTLYPTVILWPILWGYGGGVVTHSLAVTFIPSLRCPPNRV